MSVENLAEITRLAVAWGLVLPAGAEATIAAYLEELLRWNARVNLTGAKRLEELVDDHLQDSFVLARLCPAGAAVVDVGSGGGLPGIPFGLARPDCKLTLVEPRAKRVAFLRAAVSQARLGSVGVVRARAEELEPGTFALAVSRATFPPEEWLRVAQRVVVPGGIAVVLGVQPLGERIGSATLREGLSYRTRSGAPRWAGGYCFT